MLPEIILNIATFLDYDDAITLFNVHNLNSSYTKKLLDKLGIIHLIKTNSNHITKTFNNFSGIKPEKNNTKSIISLKLNNHSIYYFQPEYDGITNLKIRNGHNNIMTLFLKAGTNVIDTYLPVIEKEYPFDCLNNKIIPFVLYNGIWLELESHGPVIFTFEYITIKNMLDTYEWWIHTNEYSNFLELPIMSITVKYYTEEEYVRLIYNNLAYNLNRITRFIWKLELPKPIYLQNITIICSSQNDTYSLLVEQINLILIINGMIGKRYSQIL